MALAICLSDQSTSAQFSVGTPSDTHSSHIQDGLTGGVRGIEPPILSRSTPPVPAPVGPTIDTRNWPPMLTTGPHPGARTCQGYPEPRAYHSIQWQDSEARDLDNMRHVPHTEACLPSVVTSGIVRLDLLVKFFHGDGFIYEGIRKVVRRTNTSTDVVMAVYPGERDPGRRFDPVRPRHPHEVVEFWDQLWLDLRQVPTGSFTFEIDVSAVRPDSQKVINRLKWTMFLANTRNATLPAESSRFLHGEGWVSNNAGQGQFGYLTIEARGVRHFVADSETPITIVPQGLPGRTLRLLVLKNPDLHALPTPNYGTVLHDITFTEYGKVKTKNPDGTTTETAVGDKSRDKIVIPPPALVVGDRLSFMLIDLNAEINVGGAAEIAVITLNEGSASQ